MSRRRDLVRCATGATAVEHTLLLALVAVAAIGAYTALGDAVVARVECSAAAIASGRAGACRAEARPALPPSVVLRSHGRAGARHEALAAARAARSGGSLRGAHASGGDESVARRRAEVSRDALDDAFGVPGHRGLFRDHRGDRRLADVWPHSQGIAAALALAGRSHRFGYARALLERLGRYEKGGAYAPLAGGRGHRFYDDNAWIGLDFMQAYQQTHERRYLRAAKRIFRFLRKGISPDGGLYWREHSDQPSRNTCSTASALELALRLYMATHDRKYLRAAEKLDRFLREQMRTPDGLYMDHLSDDGQLGTEIYSYNQGAVIGANVLYYRITGDPSRLEEAQRTARAALAYLAEDDRLWHQPPAFNAIFFRNLMALYAVAPDPAYLSALDTYLERLWRDARDPRTGLFTQAGIGHYGDHAGNYLDQAAIVQLYALRDWPRRRWGDIS